MNIILLSGGSGKRLWPLSNEVRSKQFIKLFKREDGTYESMIQRVYRQIHEVSGQANITVATSVEQKSFILNQLNEDVAVCVEPSRRDTFPAIALAVSYLKDKKGLRDDEVVVVCPVDPYTDADYFSELSHLEDIVLSGKSDLALMGVMPTYPSEKYGYIIPQSGNEEISEVEKFVEKPSKDVAVKYISQGALWNCGVFALRISYILNILCQYTTDQTYDSLFEHYQDLPKISFDYAVVEKEANISCLRFKGDWKDVGTWNALTEEIEEPVIGNAVLDDTCQDLNVINELDIPILVMGGRNMIIAASPDGIFVSDKNQSSQMKIYAESIRQPVMYTERAWGTIQILKCDDVSLTAYATIRPGMVMDCHIHTDRDEVWVVLAGDGKAMIDKKELFFAAGDTIKISAGTQHELLAESDLKLLGVQFGAFNRMRSKGENVFYETPF